MRRPLMAVCMCFVAVVAVLLWMGSTGEFGIPWRMNGQKESADRRAILETIRDKEVIVAGHVYRKDTKYYYLNSVIIQNSAASLRQGYPLDKNLICEYEETAPRIGSDVLIKGTFSEFAHGTNPGEFDRKDYYLSLGIEAQIYGGNCLWEGEKFSRCQETLFRLRQYLRGRLYHIFPQKEASVMTAMLLGDKSELDIGTKELYQDNGIIHILSISGLHITIIGMSIYHFLRRCGAPIWVAALTGGCVLILYGLMTGMSISACRAIGMFLIRMLGEIVGRTYDMLTAMGVLAAGMVGANPYYLQNAGFLLSYGAILGIGVLYPVLYDRELVKNLGEKLWQSVLSGLSITLMTIPIQLWFYYEVPVWSVLLNILVLPLMTLLMTSGICAMLIPGLGVVGTLDVLILNFYECLCRLWEFLPFSTWNPGRPKVWQIVVYYGLLSAMVILHWIKEKMGRRRECSQKEQKNYRQKWYCCLQIGCLFCAVLLLGMQDRDKTRVTILDVGQGDCICMELSSGQVYLFDCGSTSRRQVGKYVLLPFLKYRGIGHLDAVFVSHLDEDHCSGVWELLQNATDWEITIGKLILPQGTLPQLEGTDVEVSFIREGDYWETEAGSFLCLHPPQKGNFSDINAYSQCFYVELEEKMTLLLTGDVEAEGEELLLNQLKRRKIEEIFMLKVAHHGSKYSSKAEILEQVNPKVAIISCGVHNRYGHPHEETLNRLLEVGSKIVSTPENGAITVEVGEKIKVYANNL